MHRIPGKQGQPRPILIKFLRMEFKIDLFRKKKNITEVYDVKIGNDITKLNQELLTRLYNNGKVTSLWFINGHVYGTDENGDRHSFDIFDNIDEKLK